MKFDYASKRPIEDVSDQASRDATPDSDTTTSSATGNQAELLARFQREPISTRKVKSEGKPDLSPAAVRCKSIEHKNIIFDDVLKPLRHTVEVQIPKASSTKGSSAQETKRETSKESALVADLLTQLKNDPSVATNQAIAVEKAFGSHGLSKFYDDQPTNITRHNFRAQSKAKKVNRKRVKLDWGPSPKTGKFIPNNVVPPSEQARRLLNAKFDEVAGPALTFSNEVDHKQIDGKFQFVNSYVRRDGYVWKTPPYEAGCRCSSSCGLENTMCSCHITPEGRRVVPYLKGKHGTIFNPALIQPDGSQQEIVECNSKCACNEYCINRRVQKGRTVPLEIFMTKRYGFGLRSSQPIKKGQFIDVYWGELLLTEEIEDYENAVDEQSCSYIFSLDYFNEKAYYHVQSIHFGGPTRFINHSCSPNARTLTVMVSSADKKMYKLAYFAIKDIPAMAEITFDYAPEAAGQEPCLPSPEDENEGVVRCLCGSHNCRGSLWPKGKGMAHRGRQGIW